MHVIIGDSTASGIVLIGILDQLAKKYPNVETVDIITSLTTSLTLTSIATYAPKQFQITVHLLEAILNAQPSDYNWAHHYPDFSLNINPTLPTQHHTWRGQDRNGQWIADTACAG